LAALAVLGCLALLIWARSYLSDAVCVRSYQGDRMTETWRDKQTGVHGFRVYSHGRLLFSRTVEGAE